MGKPYLYTKAFTLVYTYVMKNKDSQKKRDSHVWKNNDIILLSTAAKGPPVQRKPLKHRDYEVDLESRLGKTQVSFVISFHC